MKLITTKTILLDNLALFLRTKTSKHTKINYKTTIYKFIKQLENESIHLEDVINYIETLNKGYKVSTKNSELMRIKNYLEHLSTLNLTNYYPKAILKYDSNSDIEHHEPLSKSELNIINKAPKQLNNVIELLLKTGLRSMELYTFQTKGDHIVIKGKNSKIRKLNLGRSDMELAASVKLYVETMSLRTLRRRIQAFNIQNNTSITFHRLRATFATKLYIKGISIELVSLILGHSKIDTTKNYIKSLRAQSILPLDTINLQLLGEAS